MTTRLAALASALALAAGTSGCEDNRASIQIQSVCAPTDDCTFANTCDAQYISWPTLDVGASASDAVTLYLQVENQLPDNGDVANGRLNTNDAHVDEAVVEYEGAPLPKSIRGSNINIPASDSSIVKVEVVPAGSGATLLPFAGGEIVANLRFGGYYDDGTRFETGEFPITVRICLGCLGIACGGAPTCPPNSEGQAPLTCITP